MRRVALIVIVACTALLAAAPSSAWAAEAQPGWQVFSRAVPSRFSSKPALGFPDGYNITVRNAGSVAAGCSKVAAGTGKYNDPNCSQPSKSEKSGEGGFGAGGAPVTVEDLLPPHVEPTSVVGYDVGGRMVERGLGQPDIFFGGVPQLECGSHKIGPGQFAVRCTDAGKIEPAAAFGVVPPGDTLYIDITVEVSPKAEEEGESVSNVISVSGGGSQPARVTQSTPLSGEPAPFGLESFAMEASDLGGSHDTLAGDHPYEFTTTFFFDTNARGEQPEGYSPEQPKDFVTDVPPGFIGDPQVVGKCPQYLARDEACPLSTQIGVAHLYVNAAGHDPKQEVSIEPIFNEVPDKGVAAQFVFSIAGVPTTLFATVNHETNYAVRVVVKSVPQAVTSYSLVTGAAITFFGTPLTDPDIDNLSVGAANAAFLQNPMDCSAGPLSASETIDSWQHPGSWLPNGAPNLADPNWRRTSTVVYPSITGCNMLQFEPSVSLTPETTRADEPMGLNVNVEVPQAPDRFPALATPELKDTTVTLPAGVSLSPSAADGLQACSDQQIALESTEPVSCPDASVLGEARAISPLLEGALTGRVYLGTPECDPCGSADAADGRMVRIFVVVQGFGVRVKTEGRVYLNPSTGQLTSKFLNLPQEPVEKIELEFKGGLRAGLATPQSCGTFTTTSDFVPWSSPITPDATPTSAFPVDWDGHGGACPSTPPLSPSFSAGTSNPNAGQFSPFTLTFAREDREQDLSGIQVQMPPGLSGILTGVPLCGEPLAAEGKCGAASRIGTMTVAAGPGSHPFYTQGSIYLTGPYEGAPFGLSIVVPTKAGPFNLGDVVVRSKINVDPHTTALTVTTNDIPQVIAGIPVRLRTANVTIDRPGFTFNPTNCTQQKITATVLGVQGAQASVSAPFAVSGCAGLHFGPKFESFTSGHTSRRVGASLDTRLTFPKGAQSNIAHVKVDLPKALPSRLTTLQKACPARIFEANPTGCPKASVVGVARAVSPLLPVTLTGPVYFVSHGGAEFPNLIIILQGYGVRVDLVGEVFVNKANITSTTFKTVPDAPVTSFELYFPQGPNSALAANGNLCKQKLVMPTLFTAQDGAQLKQNTPIHATGCPATKNAKKARDARGSSRARTATGNHNGESGGKG